MTKLIKLENPNLGIIIQCFDCNTLDGNFLPLDNNGEFAILQKRQQSNRPVLLSFQLIKLSKLKNQMFCGKILLFIYSYDS
uniref:Uncharacterized protein n=1 Tax=Schistosoma mansoni TaxID=6183 RepID=A0A5K4F9D7_SCHMA